ncbi:2Fe-2S iron-sulfur cluster-binding protein [Variovorax sp. GT1P44]|uniref:2Fe-2S iron-sulfur cluster-binding protein n=1 Tax=Variovorax sp. GT1P44 TaxID=3443742 RepID=UPI003F44BFD3
MGRAFAEIAFTPSVKAAQRRYGSRGSNRAYEEARDALDEITVAERELIERIDGFYQASVTESGWPYVQFRGGPPGFLKVIDSKTVGYADFRGNVQYLSVGNIAADDRVALIMIDYGSGQRLKLWGRARVVHKAEAPELLANLVMPNYRAIVERAIVIKIEALDWNCPQHITRRFTETEIRKQVAPLLAELGTMRGRTSTTTLSSKGTIGSGPVPLLVTGVRILTDRVRAYELRARPGDALPSIQAGTHLPLPVVGRDGVEISHHYSIASDTGDPTRWEVAVRRDDDGSGGSQFIHAHYAVGTLLGCGQPRNGFALHDDRLPSVLIGGGIGITPLRAMAFTLQREGREFSIHFAARSPEEAPYLAELLREFPDRVRTYWSSLGASARLDLESVLRQSTRDAMFYVCGPTQMLAEFQLLAESKAIDHERVHFERFTAPAEVMGDKAFDVELHRSGTVLQVPVGRTILEVLLAAGERPNFDCRTGTCGTCATRVLSGEPDHRDLVLSKAEHDRDHLMCTCVSRSKSDRLLLDL